jgi:hypothetical protein
MSPSVVGYCHDLAFPTFVMLFKVKIIILFIQMERKVQRLKSPGSK